MRDQLALGLALAGISAAAAIAGVAWLAVAAAVAAVPFLVAGIGLAIGDRRAGGDRPAGTARRLAQKGSDRAAFAAYSRSGCTAKKEATVTKAETATVSASAESRGGEPPATATSGAGPARMYSQRTTLR